MESCRPRHNRHQTGSQRVAGGRAQRSPPVTPPHAEWILSGCHSAWVNTTDAGRIRRPGSPSHTAPSTGRPNGQAISLVLPSGPAGVLAVIQRDPHFHGIRFPPPSAFCLFLVESRRKPRNRAQTSPHHTPSHAARCHPTSSPDSECLGAVRWRATVIGKFPSGFFGLAKPSRIGGINRRDHPTIPAVAPAARERTDRASFRRPGRSKSDPADEPGPCAETRSISS